MSMICPLVTPYSFSEEAETDAPIPDEAAVHTISWLRADYP
jgi:hypothetical protein